MRDLAEAAALPERILRETYGNTEGVFLAAFDRYAGRLSASVAAALSRGQGRAALTAFFEIAVASMTDGARAEECLATRATLDPAASDHVRKRVLDLLQSLEASLTDMFQRPDVQAQLKLPPSQAAVVVMTFTRGLAVMESAYRDRTRLRQAVQAIMGVLFGE